MSDDWRNGPCGCLLCLVGRLEGYASVQKEATGRYVITKAHGSSRQQLCHPAGCPADSRAATRLQSRDVIDLPGPTPEHRAADQPDLCLRVACARVAEQQRRRALVSALEALAAGPVDASRFAPLLSRAKRSKRDSAYRQIEQELVRVLRSEMGAAAQPPPKQLDFLPALRAEYLEKQRKGSHALREARAVAAHMAYEMPTPGALVGTPPLDGTFEFHVASWQVLLGKCRCRPLRGLLPTLLRAEYRHDDTGLTFTLAGSTLPPLAWAYVWKDEGEARPWFSLSAEAAAWAAAHVEEPEDEDHEPFCPARQWWTETYGEDAADEFPLPGHPADCRAWDAPSWPPGERRDGGTVVDYVGDEWVLDDAAPPSGWDLTVTCLGQPSPNALTVLVRITSTALAYMRLWCVPGDDAHLQFIRVVKQLSMAYDPALLVGRLDDLVDEHGNPADELVAFRQDDLLVLCASATPAASVYVPRTAPDLLPLNFDEVLDRRPSWSYRDSSARSTWRYDQPWGIYGGPDLAPAAEEAAGVWTAEVDTVLSELLEQFGGYAPSVFAITAAATFPDVRAAAVSSAHLASSLYARFGPDHELGTVAALAFSRLLSLTTGASSPLRTCPLCGDRFQPEGLSVIRHIKQYGPARWCSLCLELAWGSKAKSQEEAQVAIRHLASVLGTAPSQEWYRHPVPHQVSSDQRDRLMAARMAMPHADSVKALGLSNWGQTLSDAGVLTEAAPSSRGTASRARDGHWCRSMLELAIDDFLSLHGIAHECEPGWPYHPELNPRGAQRADWRLADGTMVEAAGMMVEAPYASKIANKRLLAEALELRLLIIEPADLGRLGIVFSSWL